MEAVSAEDRSRLAELIAPLRKAPARAAILTDIDGTLAPIVDRPEQAMVPEPVRELLRDLAERYALVACLSGRAALDARALVGLDELTYSGNHGFELLEPGGDEPRPAASLGDRAEAVMAFIAELDRSELDRLGVRIEDKGPIVALHWRGATDEDEAEQWVTGRAREAESQGLATHRGRLVVEIRPDVEIDKGIAAASLLEGRDLDAVLYAGDDRTDVDAFRALDRIRREGNLSAAVRVAIASDESPPEVAANADVVVDGPEGFVAVLEELGR